MMRVTDLEKFAFEEVMRPFWPTLQEELPEGDWRRQAFRIPWEGEGFNHVGGYRTREHAIHVVAELLERGPEEWRTSVFKRLYRMGVQFPDYIQHQLVTVVKTGIARAEDQALWPS
jgi:hypothetical protein